MHWLDRIAGLVTARPRLYDPVFVDGWGDPATLESLRVAARSAPPIPDIEIRWMASSRADNLILTQGEFESPAADLLPPASRIARVLRVEPASAPVATCLMMAAFNDHGFTTRQKIAAALARRQVSCVLLENPYYGSRRAGSGQPLRTVVDFFSMGAAAVLEGRAVLAMLRKQSPTLLGVTGYSMGGNIAALISATVPFPIATAGLAASHSPGPVWSEGLLESAISWEALGGARARERIAATLGAASVLNFPPPPHTAHAVLANPVADGYIPRHAFVDLHEHWPGSELRWIPGGHASAMLWRKNDLVRAIVDSFERLLPLPGGHGY